MLDDELQGAFKRRKATSANQRAGLSTSQFMIMTSDKIISDGSQPRFMLLNMRYVAKIALIVGMLALFGMALVYFFIAGKSGGSYGAISRSYSLSQQNLGPTMLIAGLFLVAFSGFVTWLFALYTSHYIAGPLYGFARHFETMIEQGTAAPMPLRKKDRLKQEEQQIKRSIARLQLHYSDMRSAAEAVLTQPGAQSAAAIAKLKELDRATRL